jgi:hypothetical protein
MMNFISRLRRPAGPLTSKEPASQRLSARYESTVWIESTCVRGVRYCVRRASLKQRIELVQKARELSLRAEFLNAGNSSDQWEATLADLYVQQLYLDWGLVDIAGFTIDGQRPSVATLIEKGPEILAKEIVEAIQAELSLSENERKNS